MAFGETDPHEVAEQETAQATPLFPESLTTVAVNCAVVLSCTVAVGFEIEMLRAGGGGIIDLLPQPNMPTATVAAPNTPATRMILFGDVEASSSEY